MAGWCNDATSALLSIWAEQSIQSQLDGVVRNKIVYEKVAASLQEKGYEFSWKQCRTKVKNLTQAYRKAKDNNSRSGRGRITCPYYDELDAILGPRAASDPPLLLDSAGASAQGSEETEPETDTYNPPSPTPDCGAEQTDEQISSLEELPSATPPLATIAATNGTTPAATPAKIKLGKRKARSRPNTPNFLEQLAELEESAERREEEREKKRLEYEERMEGKRREREERHEERMMSMYFSFMSQFTQSTSYQYPQPTSFPPLYPQSPSSHVLTQPYSSTSPHAFSPAPNPLEEKNK